MSLGVLGSEVRKCKGIRVEECKGGRVLLGASSGMMRICGESQENPLAKGKKSSGRGTAKVLKSEIVYQGRVFGVRRDELQEPSGLRTTREVITHHGSVVVLPVLEDGRIVLIRQYRHATRQYLWELVAGSMDKGEKVKAAAARELLEETGYKAKRYSVFLEIYPSPGFLEEKMYILLAEGLTAGKAQPEWDEQIETKAYTAKELKRMLKNGNFHDAKTVAGLLHYFAYLW
jgi:ADP-ribose pyrophosphatase